MGKGDRGGRGGGCCISCITGVLARVEEPERIADLDVERDDDPTCPGVGGREVG